MTLTESYRLAGSADSKAEGAQVYTQADVPALVAMYSPLLFRVAQSVVRSRAEAEDVVQDAFVRVIQHKRLGEVLDMRVWLVRIAWNLALDRQRRKRPEQMDEVFAQSLVARDLPADQALAETRRMQVVLAEIDRLPSGEREVILLSAMDELNTAAMAEVLGKSESATRALLFRARTRLKERLARGGEAMNQEHEIDRVLQAMGAAEPAAGLEARVLARLAEPAVVAPGQRLFWPVFAAVVCALLAVLIAVRQRPRVAAPIAQAKVSAPVRPSLEPVATQKPAATHTARAPQEPVVLATAAAAPSELTPRPDRGLADLPSLYAPPAPLTAQEQELTRLASSAVARRLDVLHVDERERLADQSAADFKQFFPPPTPQEIYLATHLSD